MKAPPMVSMTVAIVLGACSAFHCVEALAAAPDRVDLQRVLPAVLNAFGSYHTALGLKEEAARDVAGATCFSKSTCTLTATLDALQSSAVQIQEEVRERQADDNRLGGSFATSAAEGLKPAMAALADWARLSHDLKGGKSAGVSRAVVRSAQKIQSSFETTVASVRAAIQYLNYSGAVTTQLESGLDAALKAD